MKIDFLITLEKTLNITVIFSLKCQSILCSGIIWSDIFYLNISFRTPWSTFYFYIYNLPTLSKYFPDINALHRIYIKSKGGYNILDEAVTRNRTFFLSLGCIFNWQKNVLFRFLKRFLSSYAEVFCRMSTFVECWIYTLDQLKLWISNIIYLIERTKYWIDFVNKHI